ncbi:hypothetical protein BBF96_03255 [Anoxybacter fermentans]|uniref:Uncharacterized protein n=1 Tax=Anoxybacter fermentans TaxID=1323375 RepID=A0A3S9SW41_9FIRM|nr:hypothetical protein [Anoxybacter fermentans]AZR72482.1 hypothetical protein BBF96_03255 [Anoxybacter fermentans]
MAENLISWPDYFPKGCPPDTARRDEVVVYRGIRNNNKVTAEDFIPLKILQPRRKFKGEDNCNACGISVFKDIKDLIKKRKSLPALKKKYPYIAIGTIKRNHGLILETYGGSHITWWVKPGVEPHTFFEVYMEDESNE